MAPTGLAIAYAPLKSDLCSCSHDYVYSGLIELLQSEEGVIVAEGYLFEFEARGYLKSGGFVPEIVLEHPELVRDLHREFVHAGSDVVLAFTYYAHREKLRLIGREHDLEKLNLAALKIAREVADETGTLMAGNLSNSTIYKPDDPDIQKTIYEMFAEQVRWAASGGVDYIVAETFGTLGESLLALKAIQEFGNGVPAVITITVPALGLWDGLSAADVCRHLEEAGAAVVGLNCGRGPATMLPLLRDIRKVCKGPIAALPVVYRTDEAHPSFQALDGIDDPNTSAFPIDLGAWMCSRRQIAEFSREAWAMGVRYLGLCCGNRAHYLRTMAETVGRSPPASRYSPDMTMHYSRMKDDRHSYTQGTFASVYKTN